MSLHVIHANNTSTVELRGLKTSVNQLYVSDADVKMTLQTASGVPVAGQSWPITLTYQAGSKGRYIGSFSSGVAIVPDIEYRALIVATLPNGSVGTWLERVEARERGASPQFYSG